MEKNGCIYLVTCIENNKKYVGQYTYENPTGRFKRHLSNNQKDTCVFHRALWKYGKDAFKLETLGIFPHSSLNNMEAYYAEQFQSYIWDTNEEANISGGYNMMLCGQMNRQGMKHTSETLEKLSKASKGRKHTEETKSKISKGNTGKKMSAQAVEKHRQSMLGYKHTDEAKANMSKAGKGKKHTEESKEKMSKSKKGWNPSAETRANMSLAQKGKKRSVEEIARRKAKPKTDKQIAQLNQMHENNKGRTHTDETKQLLREAQYRRWQKWREERDKKNNV
jgi:group I intron endonuclease